MKERPILFSGPMVRAILEGRKTMTRRVVKLDEFGPSDAPGYDFTFRKDGLLHDVRLADMLNPPRRNFPGACPYGTIGDRLWVRETWRRPHQQDNSKILPGQTIQYRATNPWTDGFGEDWHPSIHMPRWASRINLEITDIRVERVQDISEEDAKAEGIDHLFRPEEVSKRPELAEAAKSWKNYMWHGDYGSYGLGNKFSATWPHQFSSYNSAVGSFSSLWHKLNSKSHPWASNPWVWVIEFRRAE